MYSSQFSELRQAVHRSLSVDASPEVWVSSCRRVIFCQRGVRKLPDPGQIVGQEVVYAADVSPLNGDAHQSAGDAFGSGIQHKDAGLVIPLPIIGVHHPAVFHDHGRQQREGSIGPRGGRAGRRPGGPGRPACPCATSTVRAPARVPGQAPGPALREDPAPRGLAPSGRDRGQGRSCPGHSPARRPPHSAGAPPPASGRAPACPEAPVHRHSSRMAKISSWVSFLQQPAVILLESATARRSVSAGIPRAVKLVGSPISRMKLASASIPAAAVTS